MRLLLATDHYLPHAGGSVRVVQETGGRLLARGHEVEVLTFERDGSLPLWDEVEGLLVRRIPLRGRLSTYPRGWVGSRRALRDLLHQDGYDIVHIHLPLIGLGTTREGGGKGIPLVYSFHGPWHLEMGTELLAKPRRESLRPAYGAYVSLLCRGLRAWQGTVLRRADRVHVLSEHFRQQVEGLFPAVDPERLALIPGGVDVKRFRPADDRASVRAMLGLAPERKVLLTIRRLVPRMGLERLLEAMGRLVEERDDLLLVVGGQGRLADALRALAEELGLEGHVRFAGFIPEEELAAYYQAADLFVLPTQALEGFGLITLEALASGLPVVGTPVGATPELLGRFDPRFVTEGTGAEDLVAGIRRGAEIADREGGALSERCRSFAKDYDWERIVDQYEALYHEVLEAARGA